MSDLFHRIYDANRIFWFSHSDLAYKLPPMQWRKSKYSLTDELPRLDLDAVCALLHSTYWAATRSRKLIAKSLQHSLNFGLFCGGAQVGFARLVTDFATVGYLCDVIISEEHRGKGIGKWMLSQILAHPGLRGCRIDLFTRSAQDFYHPFGFGPHTDKSLVRYPPDSKRGTRLTAKQKVSAQTREGGMSIAYPAHKTPSPEGAQCALESLAKKLHKTASSGSG